MGTFVNRLEKVFWHPQFNISATTCSQLKCTPTFRHNILSETTINHPQFLLDFDISVCLCIISIQGLSCTIKKMLVFRQSRFDPEFSADKVLTVNISETFATFVTIATEPLNKVRGK